MKNLAVLLCFSWTFLLGNPQQAALAASMSPWPDQFTLSSVYHGSLARSAAVGEGYYGNLYRRMVDAQDFSLRWTRTYDGDDYDDDSGNGVAVAADGSIYVTGATFVRAKGMKFLLLKYSSSGAPRWVRTYNRAAYDASWGLGVAVAADGSIYVTGHDSGKLLLRKYSPDGALRWAGAYNPSTQEDAGHGVAVAADGSVYVTGSIGIPEHGSGLPSHDEHLLSTPYGVHESGPTSDVLLLKYK